MERGLKYMVRILLTNDDGIHSDGLTKLEAALRELGDVYVVAPASEMSGASHSLTLSRPLRIRKIDERHWTVDGTPTDCVTLALNQILGPGEIRGVRVTRQGIKNARPIITEHIDPRGKAYYWIGEEYFSSSSEDGTDYAAVEAGRISVTPMRSDMTNHSALDALDLWNRMRVGETEDAERDRVVGL